MKHARLVAGATAAAVVMALVVVVVAAVGDSTGRTPASSATGVAGTVTLVNPGGPMIAPGQSPPPAPRLMLELLSPGTRRPIAHGETAPDGTFRIAAPQGSYLMRIATAAGGRTTTLSYPVEIGPAGYAHVSVGPLRGL